MSERRWVSIDEISKYFSLPKKTLYSLAARKRLPVGSTIRIGRTIRFDVLLIEAGLSVDGGRTRKGGAK